MRLQETRSAGEGLERSCRDGWLASSRPADGVELFRAWFAGEAYRKHRHDTYAIGVTDSGVQVFDYRGACHASTPGQVVVLYPDGTSPYRYLLMRRLALARELLHGGRPLVEVALEAGFADQAHFTRAFTAAFGLTPARYRALRAARVAR